jgi:hypothetical protein
MITKADIDKFHFREYRKIGTTKISDETLPIGTKIETSEGIFTLSAPSALAIDADGNVYPITESVIQKSFELVK